MSAWLRLDIRVRLTVLLVLVLAGSLAVSGLVAYAIQRASLTATVDRSLSRTVEQVGVLAENGVMPDTGEPPADSAQLIGLAMMRLRPLDTEGMLGFQDGRPSLGASEAVRVRPEEDPALVRWAAERSESPAVVLDTVRTEETTWRAVVVPVEGADPQDEGMLLLAVDMEAEVERLEETFLGYLLTALASILLVAGVGRPLLQRMFVPLERLRSTALEVSERDLNRRVEVLGADDVAELGHAFNAMLDRLEGSFEAQRRLLDDAGHELRTPVTIVAGHLEVMDPHDPADVEQTRCLTLDELDRMSRLVDDLLTLAKAQQPALLRPEEVDLADLTHSALDRSRPLGERAWGLESTAEGTAVLDPQRIMQAWLQLASNAVRYSDPGAAVLLGSDRRGDTVRLWVKDAGVGVPPEDRETIFERFGRGRHGSRGDGSGLGLAIVASIVEGHGGRVTVDSVPGIGSVFTMEIPAAGLRPVAPEAAA